MSSGGTVNRLLDSIPGYGGYRDKERRRESDRLIREKLARDYGAQADRLADIARALSENRKILLVRYVDQPHDRLKTFCTRLSMATYGYAPLFGDRQIDGDALDQIAQFDQSLADQLDPLATKITELESTAPDSEDFKVKCGEIDQLIRGLQERFSMRVDVIESGHALPQQRITGALADPEPEPETPTAYKLHQHEAISRNGINYSIKGRITIQTPLASWRDFQLEGGDGKSFLQVPAHTDGQFLWLNQVDLSEKSGATRVNVGGSVYTLVSQVSGSSEVLGKGGGEDGRPVTCYHYQQESGAGYMNIYDWGSDRIALAGEQIDPLEIEVWSREGTETV